MGSLECWVHCHSCQQCVNAQNTTQVQAPPSYSADDGYFIVRDMVPATVCNSCFRDYYSPAIQSGGNNGELQK